MFECARDYFEVCSDLSADIQPVIESQPIHHTTFRANRPNTILWLPFSKTCSTTLIARKVPSEQICFDTSQATI